MTIRFDPETGTYHVSHADAGHASLSDTVSQAICRVADLEGLTVSTALFSAVDPDAIDRLFRATRTSPRERGHIEFTLEELTVIVHADGHIVIDPRDEE